MGYQPIGMSASKPPRVYLAPQMHKSHVTTLRLNVSACELIGFTVGEYGWLGILWDEDQFRMAFESREDGDPTYSRRLKVQRSMGVATSVTSLLRRCHLTQADVVGTHELRWDSENRLHYIDLSAAKRMRGVRSRFQLIRTGGGA
jgi:hypothetical protein